MNSIVGFPYAKRWEKYGPYYIVRIERDSPFGENEFNSWFPKSGLDIISIRPIDRTDVDPSSVEIILKERNDRILMGKNTVTITKIYSGGKDE